MKNFVVLLFCIALLLCRPLGIEPPMNSTLKFPFGPISSRPCRSLAKISVIHNHSVWSRSAYFWQNHKLLGVLLFENISVASGIFCFGFFPRTRDFRSHNNCQHSVGINRLFWKQNNTKTRNRPGSIAKTVSVGRNYFLLIDQILTTCWNRRMNF